jgi:hypothetical protein
MIKRLLLICILFLSVHIIIHKAEAFTPPDTYYPLDVIEGAGLYKTSLPNGNQVYLQIIDLRKIQIDQIIGEIDDMGIKQGKYYQNQADDYSPYFQNKPFENIWNEYNLLYGKKVFSLINCAFFEEYKSSTQLAFPAKLNGQIITAGSSPYGPSRQAINDYYKNIKLKALVWNHQNAYITDYELESGYPLNKQSVKNALVTYRYSDHPAKVLGKNLANKYHVIGTLNKDGVPGNELIIILTVNQATLDEAAELLRKIGIKGDIITIDGGSSTLITNPHTGALIVPQPVNMKSNPFASNLPHYLGFRQKGNSKEQAKIFISQPVNNIPIKANIPYLILWRDNLVGQIKIELKSESKQAQVIAAKTTNDGIYKWTPEQPILSGSMIQVTSLEQPNIFAKLELK